MKRIHIVALFTLLSLFSSPIFVSASASEVYFLESPVICGFAEVNEINGGSVPGSVIDGESTECKKIDRECNCVSTREQIFQLVVARDVNGTGDIANVYMDMDNEPIVQCNDVTDKDYCNNKWFDKNIDCSKIDGGFNPNSDKIFECIMTVTDNMQGVHNVTVEAYNQTEILARSENQSWKFNPKMSLDILFDDGSDNLNIEMANSGQTIYSKNHMIIKNTEEPVKLFIGGTDYVSNSGKCPFSNVIDSDKYLEYRCGSDSNWKFVLNRDLTKSYSDESFYGVSSAGYLDKNQETSCYFRFTVPVPCVGSDWDGQIIILAKSDFGFKEYDVNSMIFKPAINISTTTTTTVTTTTPTTTTTTTPTTNNTSSNVINTTGVTLGNCTYGTVTPTKPLSYGGKYYIYPTQGGNDFVYFVIKDQSGNIVDALSIAGWSSGISVSKNSVATGFTITLTSMAVFQNGTVIGVDLAIEPTGVGCVPPRNCTYGTATPTRPVSYDGKYYIYATQGGSSFVSVTIKDKAGTAIDTLLLTGWSSGSSVSKDSAATGLTITATDIAAMWDGTVVGADLIIEPTATRCVIPKIISMVTTTSVTSVPASTGGGVTGFGGNTSTTTTITQNTATSATTQVIPTDQTNTTNSSNAEIEKLKTEYEKLNERMNYLENLVKKLTEFLRSIFIIFSFRN